jgi:hypothetical protein
MTDEPIRTMWWCHDLSIKDEPLIKSLWEYRQEENRFRTRLNDKDPKASYGFSNLISSITVDGRQMPIIDMDFPHHVVPSTTPGHTHLYIDVPMNKVRWICLMVALRLAGVIETGFFVWSLRRGGNFVRIPGTEKDPETSVKPTYGWFRKLR